MNPSADAKSAPRDSLRVIFWNRLSRTVFLIRYWGLQKELLSLLQKPFTVLKLSPLLVCLFIYIKKINCGSPGHVYGGGLTFSNKTPNYVCDLALWWQKIFLFIDSSLESNQLFGNREPNRWLCSAVEVHDGRCSSNSTKHIPHSFTLLPNPDFAALWDSTALWPWLFRKFLS